MPIMGVSDEESLDPRTKEIGRLYKGSPKKNGGQVGDDLDYFRFVSPDPVVQKIFEDAYGPKPDRLKVYFWYRTMKENFSSWRELYGRNQLCKERCDGNYIRDWIDGPRHYHGRRLCDKPCKDTANRCPGCPLVPTGRLNLVLPALWETGHFGLVMLTTHGWNDIAHLSSKLKQWEPNTGREFVLWRQWDRVGAPIQGKRAAVEKSLVHLELTDEWLQRQLTAYTYAALDQVQVAALPEPAQDAPDDGELEVVEGEPVDEPEPPRPIDLGFQPDMSGWENGKHWTDLRQLAVDHLGFDDREAVAAALKTIFENNDKDKITYQAAWSELVNHQRSKLADAA